MRVLSYNIHKGIGNDRRYRVGRVLEVIAAQDADVVCLQEVDRNVRRSRFHDQPSHLVRELDVTGFHYQLNVPIRSGGYGNLLLSRWPMHEAGDIPLRLGRRKPRAAQLAVVEGPFGCLVVVNWHLGLFERERRWQVDQLLTHPDFRAHTADAPAVIVGDTNDWRNRLHRRFTLDGFEHVTAPVGEYRSFPSFLPMMSLDKAFVRGVTAEARVVRTPLSQRASDHLPLILDLELGSPSPAAR